jgi:type I restriction enzyme R subunit
MNDLHREISFETEVCDYLAAHGWHYAEGDATQYDRALALFPPDLVAWAQASYPKAWESLTKNHGMKAAEVLLARVREQINTRGTLDVLRHGVEMMGLRSKLPIAQFKPALAMNPDLQARYAANRLRVVRQVRYSQQNENCIDLVLFLNGLPLATVELKTDFTQSVEDAVDQYRFNRLPHPKGQPKEPLLSFPSGALVHFAVSNNEVHMTTNLQGPATRFLPFNKGDNGAAGNPPNPKSGHRTAYLWEEVWERESWLEIIGRYLITEKDEKKQIVNVIFPRYHQLDVTRKLVASVYKCGAGGKYLIQHSAGSGKTNSIAWSAHFLADLHDANQKKVFDSVLVISDRNVIDKQLQDAIFDFERTKGVVAVIKGEEASKSKELGTALNEGKKIVVCTIQTFPFALKTVQELAATQGKHFAVIADEAHSSQTGAAAAKLRAVLSAEEMKEIEDGGEVSTEDLLSADMTTRANQQGITYVAFTATPKAKTLELFGVRPNPDLPAGADDLPQAFHVYSMRQAIEEKFILDVLQNYTSYKLAFKLAQNGREIEDEEVERSAAMKGIMRWVRLHPYNISQKVQIVVEHFRENVQPLLNGHAKAMVVVGSRVEAVRWHLAITKYIKSQNYKLGALVAFSGEVRDPESGSEPFTEKSSTLNPGLRGREIQKAFDTDDYQILLAANKFQTGFDQKLLCGMYVDKRLAGIQAVQTLSRLNRAYSGLFGEKKTTYVLDFIDSNAEAVLEAFNTYYATAELEAVTDPNLVYDLRMKLDAAGHYDDFEVNRVVDVELNPKSKQSDLVAALEPIASRLLSSYKQSQKSLRDAQETKDSTAVERAKTELESLILFKRDMETFQRVYTFLSQIFDYANPAIEARHIFFRRLLPLLEFGREREKIDLSKITLTHHNLRNKGKQAMVLGKDDQPKLQPQTDIGSGSVQDKEKAALAAIIAIVNDLFEGELTEDDKVVYVNNVIKGKLLESEVLAQQAASNTKEQFSNSPDLAAELMNAIMDAFTAHSAMSKQALESEKVREGLKQVLLGPAQLYEALRARNRSLSPVP